MEKKSENDCGSNNKNISLHVPIYFRSFVSTYISRQIRFTL